MLVDAKTLVDKANIIHQRNWEYKIRNWYPIL